MKGATRRVRSEGNNKPGQNTVKMNGYEFREKGTEYIIKDIPYVTVRIMGDCVLLVQASKNTRAAYGGMHTT